MTDKEREIKALMDQFGQQMDKAAPGRLFFVLSVDERIIEDEDFDDYVLVTSNCPPDHAQGVLEHLTDHVGRDPEPFRKG